MTGAKSSHQELRSVTVSGV